MTEKLSDCWRTPQWLFNELNEEFNFDVDLCATRHNKKCSSFFTDYFVIPPEVLQDLTCFMNPPYSRGNMIKFMQKAWEDSKVCKIVCLVKADPSTKWWATFWDYEGNCNKCHEDPRRFEEVSLCCLSRTNYSGPKPGCEVRFFPRRIKFDPPLNIVDGQEIPTEHKNGPTFPSALIIMDRRGIL